MKKYDYTNSKLGEKYQLVTEGAHLVLRKEMFKEECWDPSADRPIPECWTESGEIKQECWSSGPGMTSSQPGYAGTAGGESLEEKAPSRVHELAKHISLAKECAGNWMAESAHPYAETVLEALHHLEEVMKECATE